MSAAGEGTDDDDPSSILMRRIVDAFSEYERLLIKARTRAALAAKARRGERTGQVPYGKRLAEDGQTLLDDQAEQGVLEIIGCYADRGRSHRWIARRLDEMLVPTKNGGRWAHSTVRRLIDRTRERGEHGQGEIEVQRATGAGAQPLRAAPDDHPGPGPDRLGDRRAGGDQPGDGLPVPLG